MTKQQLLRDAYICTANMPWREDLGVPVVHPDAREIGDQEDGWPGGDLVNYLCPHCGHRWRMELPQ